MVKRLVLDKGYVVSYVFDEDARLFTIKSSNVNDTTRRSSFELEEINYKQRKQLADWINKDSQHAPLLDTIFIMAASPHSIHLHRFTEVHQTAKSGIMLSRKLAKAYLLAISFLSKTT